MNIRNRGRFASICVIAATVGFAVAGGCASPGGSEGGSETAQTMEAAGLVGTTWIAEDIRGGGVIDNLPSTLTFESFEQVTGSGGCNRYAGPVRIDGRSIAFGPLAATRMACPPAIDDQETKFFAALEDARRFALDSRGLLFLYASEDTPILRLSSP